MKSKIVATAIVVGLILMTIAPIVTMVAMGKEGEQDETDGIKPIETNGVVTEQFYCDLGSGMSGNGGYMQSYNIADNYPSALSGINLEAYRFGELDVPLHNNRVKVGQYHDGASDFKVWRTHLTFATFLIPDSASISSASIHCYVDNVYTTVAFDVEIYSCSYATSYNEADWNPSSQAYQNDLYSTSQPQNAEYTANVNPAVIQEDAVTQFVLKSSREGSAPTGNEWVEFVHDVDAPYNYQFYLEVTYSIANPVADIDLSAIPDQYYGVKHILGENSYHPDPEVDIAWWNWTVIDPTSFKTYQFSDTNPNLINYLFNVDGTWVFYLNVTDDKGQIDMDVNSLYIMNTPPVADAGSNQVGTQATAFTLDASGSYDPDEPYGDHIINYSWRITTATGYEYHWNVGVTHLYSFGSDYIGVHECLLIVFDETLDGDSDSCYITLNSRNPVADAGSNQAGTKGNYVFDGSGSSDPDEPYDLITNWTWEFSYNSSIVNIWGETPSFDFKYEGVYTVSLVVKDDYGLSSSGDTMQVSISNQNPVADAGTSQSGIQGNYILDGSGSSDPDHPFDWLEEWTWEFDYDGTPRTLLGESQNFDFNIVGVYPITLTVEDNEGFLDVDATTSITILNQLPIADAGVDQTGIMDTYAFDGSGSSDPDFPYGWIVNWTWEFTYDSSTETIWGETPNFDFHIIDDYEVTLTVKDNEDGTDTDIMWVNITNQLPIADAGVVQSGLIGTYSFDGSGSYDPDSPYGYVDNWTWEFTYDGLPEAVWGESTSFDFQRSGDYEITLTVTDDYGGIGTGTTWVNITNQNPTADAGLDAFMPYGSVYAFDGSGSYDIDGDVVNYTWEFTHNSTPITLWEINPTFRFWDVVGITVTLTVKDNFDAIDTDQMVITINYDRDPIRIDSDGDFTIDNGVISGSGISGDPYLIDGWYIDATGQGQGIYIGNTTAYYIIQNCTIVGSSGYAGQYGVNYYDDFGITLNDADHGFINDCSILDANSYVWYVQSNYIEINYTVISNSVGGLAFNGHNLTFTNNTILDSYNVDTFYIFNSKDILIKNNSITLSTEQSVKCIELNSATENVTITKNTITNYIGETIYITASNDNLIYKNNFINHGTPFDNGINRWNLTYNDTEYGNYWSEYLGADIYHGYNQDILGYDGIGDIAYSPSITDHYPLMEYWENYTTPIAHTGEDSVEYVWWGLYVEYNASESLGVMYPIVNYTWEFTHNATPITMWGEEMSFTFWQIGTINITLTVKDSNDQTDQDWIDAVVSYNRNPIRINSDGDFNVGNGVSSGSGTLGDPYIIKDWYIDATGFGCGIFIGNTTAHFEIYDCVVHDATGVPVEYYYNTGIYLYNTLYGNITDNFVYNCELGAFITGSSYTNTSLNEVYDCDSGIICDFSDNGNVFDNDNHDITNANIILQDCSDYDVFDNIISYSDQGITTYSTTINTNIYSNEVSYCNYGIDLDTDDVMVYNNTIHNSTTGIRATGVDCMIYHNNLIDNTIHTLESGSNYWDIGHQFGGNYYGSLVGVDDYHGVDQNILGSDNIYDSPFWTDNYPLVNKFETNNLPLADAGIDLYYPRIHHINGTNCSDAGGLTLNYTWTFHYDGTDYTFYTESFDFDFSTVEGHYIISLEIRDGNGNIDSDTITVYATELSADAGLDDTIYRLNPFTFDGSGSLGLISTYEWNFVHNSTMKTLWGINPIFNFWQLGTFNVTLTVTDIYTDTAVDWVEITILNNDPVADAGVSQGTLKGEYTLDGSGSSDSDGNVVNYTWTFWDGGLEEIYGVAPTYDFQNQGDFPILLTITDNDGGTDTSTTWVNITWLYPIADAGVSQAGLKGYYTLDGSGSSDPDGVVLNYTWNFNYDGTPTEIYLTYPMFNFIILGDYEITLTIRDDSGLTDTSTTWVNITNADPTADAGIDITGKRLITFDGSGTTDVDGTIAEYKWTFSDDGTPVTIYGIAPTYDFNISQSPITVTLTVTDDEGGTDTDTMIVTLVFVYPIADAGANQGTNKGEYTFDGSGSYDPDGSIVDWTWTFTYLGHPETLHGVSPSFIFLEEIATEITLTVMDDDGRKDTSTTWVTITFKDPVADFFQSPDDTNKGIKTLDASPSTDVDGYIVNWHWSFNYDGTDYNYYTEQISFAFTEQGIYTITLTVEDNDGLTDVGFGSVEIISKDPISIIDGNITTVLMFNNIDFSGFESYDEDGDIVLYTWNFTYGGEEYVFYGVNFTHRFSDVEGNVTLYLTVTDDDGKTNTDSITFEVQNPNRLLADILLLLIPLIIILLMVMFIIRYMKQNIDDEG